MARVDEAMNFYGPLEEFLRQGKNERADLAQATTVLGANSER